MIKKQNIYKKYQSKHLPAITAKKYTLLKFLVSKEILKINVFYAIPSTRSINFQFILYF